MSEHDHMDEFDLKMRSILENGQEEVPAGVWEGVSAGLAKAAGRRKAAMWFRYSGIATAAAAAAVAIGIFLNRDVEADLVPTTSEDMIAVVETASEEGSTQTELSVADIASEHQYLCMAEIPEIKTTDKDIANEPAAQQVEQPVEQVIVPEEDQAVGQIEEQKDVQKNVQEQQEVKGKPVETDIIENIIWEDEDRQPRKRINTSLVISGIAGTNSPQNKAALKPLKSPGIFKAPEKTTIEQVSGETTYGIPVSFGVGVKLNFTERWSLGMGVNYTFLSSSFTGKYTKVENGVPHVPLSERIKSTQHYVGIPVNAYYNIVSRDFINFYAYAGGAVEKCVENMYEIQTTPIINHKEKVNGAQLSANVGMGVEFLLGKYVGIYLDPSLRYYFDCNQPKNIRTAQPLMLGFEAGVRFNL